MTTKDEVKEVFVSVPEHTAIIKRHPKIALEGLNRLSGAPNLCGMGDSMYGEGRMLTLEAFAVVLNHGTSGLIHVVVDVLTFLGFARNAAYSKERGKKQMEAVSSLLCFCSGDSTPEELEEAVDLLRLRWQERKNSQRSN